MKFVVYNNNTIRNKSTVVCVLCVGNLPSWPIIYANMIGVDSRSGSLVVIEFVSEKNIVKIVTHGTRSEKKDQPRK